MKHEIIAALDVPSAREAAAAVARIGDAVSFYKVGLELFLADGLDDGEVAALEERIRGTEGTGEVLFVDKSAAAERFTRAFGADALDLAGDNPLPRSFDVWPDGDFRNAFRYRPWMDRLAALPGVGIQLRHRA